MQLNHATITVHHLTDDQLNMWRVTFCNAIRTAYGFDYFCNGLAYLCRRRWPQQVARLSVVEITMLCSRLLLKTQVNCRDFLVYTVEFQCVNSRFCVAMMVFAPIYVAQM